MNFSNIRLLRTVKRDTLRLVRSFLDAATVAGAAEVRLTPEQIAQRFVPPLLEPRAFWEGMGAQGTLGVCPRLRFLEMVKWSGFHYTDSWGC